METARLSGLLIGSIGMASTPTPARGGRFVPGGPGGPGRPKGSRNKLGERYLADLERAWKTHGPDVIERVAAEEPAVLLRVIASLLPRELLLQNAGGGSLTLQVITGVPAAEVEESGITIDQSEMDRIHEPLTKQRPSALPIERTPAEREAMRRQREQRDA